MINNSNQHLVEVEVKGMWFKIINDKDEIMEVIIPVREPNSTLKKSYLHKVKILDQNLVSQTITIPYSTLITDGKVETTHFSSKYVAERGDE